MGLYGVIQVLVPDLGVIFEQGLYSSGGYIRTVLTLGFDISMLRNFTETFQKPLFRAKRREKTYSHVVFFQFNRFKHVS